MAAVGTRIAGDRNGGDSLRRLVLASLAVYLAPALLVVLLIGGLGMACCGVLRLVGGTSRAVAARARRDGPAHAIGRPHVREVTRSRSPNC